MEAEYLYKKILGIELPWLISDIEIDEKTHHVTVVLDHAAFSQFACSKCGNLCSVHDHQAVRLWRHLDTCQYETYLKAAVPRVKCGICGIIKASIPWAQPYSRFSELFECHAIDLLQNCQVIERSALQLRITPDQLNYLMKKSVERGLALRQKVSNPIKKLAIDEKSRQTGHNYVTILSDADEGKVLEVSEDRTLESVQKVYNALNTKQLASVESVSMDMWSAFETVTKQIVPQADVVHDRFHLSAYLNNAVDITRRAENKKLVKNEDKSLQNTKYLWLKNPDNLTEQDKERLFDIVKNNKAPNLVTVYQLKEAFKDFFHCPTAESANQFFKDWQLKVQESQNTQLIKVATMFEKHFTGILSYIKHQVTNAIAEGLNSRIQQLKAKARGFKSAAAFRIAILFHFGKLHLYPKVGKTPYH
jgi:transposase